MANTVAYSNRGSVASVTPCESSDCSPALVRNINVALDTIGLLARQGLWTQAGEVFRTLRETCLAKQPNTLDLFSLPIADTTLGSAYRTKLEQLSVHFVGQLQHVSAADLAEVGIGVIGRREVRTLCCRYKIRLRGESAQ